MLKSLKLVNFQAHKSSKLEFSEKVNTIIGSSDNGKTSVIRALNWIIKNKPSGNAFIRNGEDNCLVEVQIDSHKIEKYKSDQENYYKINDHKLEAFGQNVPQEIIDVFNFDDVNIQNQFDTAFLVMSTSGEIARILNKIVDLEIIGKSLSNIERKRRDINKTIEFVRDDIEEYTKNISLYDWLDDFEIQLIELKRKEEFIIIDKEKLETLKEIIINQEKINKELVVFTKCLEQENYVKTLELFTTEFLNKLDIKKRLESIIVNIEYEKQNLNCYKNIDVFEIKNDLLEKGSLDINILYTKRSLLKNIILTQSQIEKLLLEIDSYNKELNEIMPDICPVCGQGIKKGVECE